MIDRTADWLAGRLILWSGMRDADEGRLAYQLALWLNTLAIVAGTCLVSVFTGTFFESMAVLIAIAVMRSVWGGVHLPNLDVCAVFTIGLAAAVPVVAGRLPESANIFISLLSSGIIIWKIYQSRSVRKWLLLLISILASVAWNGGVLALCLLVQALSLLPSASHERRDQDEKGRFQMAGEQTGIFQAERQNHRS